MRPFFPKPTAPAMRSAFLIASALSLAACASVEGPGSLGQVNTAQQATQPITQTAPGPAPVASQTLAAPGTTQNQPQSQQIGGAGSQSIFAAPDQPSQDPLVSAETNAGRISLPPNQTLDDFSTIDPRVFPENDPFAGQRTSLDTAIAQPGTQETIAQSIEQSLTGERTPGLLQPARPQYPRAALAPISTAPEPQSTQLFDAVDDAMFDGGMQLVFFGDETAQFVVRSQVSAIPTDSSTSVLYSFDVLDARGTLRHRVVGNLALPQSGPNGWDFVSDAAIETIAQDVAGQLLPWFRANAVN